MTVHNVIQSMGYANSTIKHMAITPLIAKVFLLVIGVFCGAVSHAQEYLARMERVIDGDTIVVIFEPYPDVLLRTTVRVDGVNTPESRRGPGITPCEVEAGVRAKAFTQAFTAGGRLVIKVHKREKFGRTLADVEVDGVDLKAALIKAGLGRAYEGEARGPWCER